MDCTDDRKKYFIDVISTIFEINRDNISEKIIADSSLNNFLDNFSCNLLLVNVSQDLCNFSNELPEPENSPKNNQLIFLKIKSVVLTKETLKTSIHVMTLLESPIATFLQALNNFYIPVLLSHDVGREPQVQNTLKILDYRLKYALNKVQNEESFVITNLKEEIRYWDAVAESAKSAVEKKKAKTIWEVLASVENDFNGLERMLNLDLEEVIESCTSMLDDLWRIEPNAYSQERMEKLIEMIGNTIALHMQKKIDAINVWTDDYDLVKDTLNSGIVACEKWNQSLHTLCTIYWSTSGDRNWRGAPYEHKLCVVLKTRLQEIKNVRTTHRQLTRLLSLNEQKELGTATVFSYFEGLKPAICSPYTEGFWKAALQQFEKSLVSVEQKVALKLKTQLNHLNANTLQLLRETKRYEELIKRPNIASHLAAERENLLGALQDYVNGILIDEEQNHPLLDLPPVVNKIYQARISHSKVKEVSETTETILHDLKGSAVLSEKCKDLLVQLQDMEKREFEEWVQNVREDIKVKELTLSENSKVLRLKAGQMVEVNFPSRLVQLTREVRQLLAMGLNVPKSVKEVTERAMKFMHQAKDLEKIANFHNTIGDRIIPSQKPMLLSAAQELDSLINSQQTVTWNDTSAVDKYITNLQEVVEKLSKQNNKLAFYHGKLTEKVIILLNADIIRQQNLWKQNLREMREIITQVEFMKFPNMKSWKLHWDYQLYKALECQYQLCLCNLHFHFPEIKVELIYRQQNLQFLPPIEEIRMKYYSQVKKFLSIPCSFSGVSENTNRLFSTIISRNASRFEEVYVEAENLFDRLQKVKKEWSKWMVLGGVNMEELAEEYLKEAEDWDLNFRSSKNFGQEIAKLPYNDEKIGCITVSTLALRAEMELHNRKYWDTLNMTLQTSILRDVAILNKYICDAVEILNAQPKTISEVGEANIKHAQLVESSVDMQKAFENTIRKNKTLASWTKEKIEQVGPLIVSWDNFQSSLQNHKSLISKQVERMKIALQGETENLLTEVEKFNLRWEALKPKDTDIQDADVETLKKTINFINEKMNEWNELQERKNKLIEESKKFEMSEPELEIFNQTEDDLRRYHSMWSFYDDFYTELSQLSKEEWFLFRGKTYKLDDFLKSWEKKVDDKGTTSVTVKMLQEIDTYKAVIPLLKYLRGEMFSDKHWLELFDMLGIKNKSPESLTLGDFLTVKQQIIISAQELQALNTEAASEISIRQSLGELDAWEVQSRFVLTLHSDSTMNSLKLIKNFSDIINKIGDNKCLLQSVLNSTNSKRFADRITIWDNKLTSFDELVGNLNVVQRKWVYLEPIFKNGSFAMEQGKFERVDQDFRYIMSEISKDNRITALLKIVNLKQTLTIMIDQLSRCQNSLNQYLQEKRSIFPRFYFLGDEDLLELLGQSSKEQVIQTHLKKIFSGINSVCISDGYVTSIKSLQGETVNLNGKVKVTNCIEEWLHALNEEVKKTLRLLLIQFQIEIGSKDLDPYKFPSQILCLGEYLWFTLNCEKHISNGMLQNFHDLIKAKLDRYSENLKNWQEKDSLLQLKLKDLLNDTVHHIRIVESLIDNKVNNINDWHWQKQLRYYLNSDGNLVVRMVDAELFYTYEYQGNAPKLVWTPLTEKCFLTLTQAIRMGLGGNPFGPAGTGKTESVKALGGLLGRQVLVFNCDKGIDVKSMGRILIGLVKCGAWGCFDEFNRLEEETLSAVSMLIQPIQVALQENQKIVKLLQEEVAMNSNCGLFVTMNPAGKKYGGRKKLPNNLKQLFRPIVMSAPDEKLIARVSLLCEGFKEADMVGTKLVEVFDLAKNLLSKQQHYDWGLRALKTVLGSCGALFKENQKYKTSSELEVAVKALRLNTLSKLTFKDAILFDKIVNDVFVGIKFISLDFQKMTEALKSSCEELNLKFQENQIKKCIELYEQMQQRMGVALVGSSGTGKSTILKLLKHALQKLGKNIKQYILNPKSMPRAQFFGQIDLDTRQWSEGVLTSTALKLHAESQESTTWLICDGDIDPDWVEALNSVLDDNRILTLPSGWRIQFGPNVNFIFETSDLNHASPATVSRMGIIFLSDQIIDISIVINSWLSLQSEESKHIAEPYISNYFYKSVEWIRKNGTLAVPYSLIGLINSGLSHLVNVTDKSQFVMSLIYGLGANLVLESRELFAKYVFELTGEFVPDPSKILDCYYNKNRQRIDIFPTEVNEVDSTSQLSLVPTNAIKSSISTLEPWLESFQPILIYGSEGCGKTLLVNYCLSKIPAIEIATVYCSDLISPEQVIQKIRQFCIVTTSSSGKILRPKNSQKLVIFIKNLELAVPDIWGTNMLVTWLQQVITYQGFYDNDLEWTSLERIQIIGTISEGPYQPATRFTSITRICSVSPPAISDLKMIYSIYVKAVILKKFEKHKIWNKDSKITYLVSTLISIYEKIRSNFTKVNKKHYCFSPKYLTRWCEEIQRYTIEEIDSERSFLEVVVYVAFRLFYDRLVDDADRQTFKDFMYTIIEQDWSCGDLVSEIPDIYFAFEETSQSMRKIDKMEWSERVKKGLTMAVGHENEIMMIDELLRLTSSLGGILSAPNSSAVLAGRPGVGRKTALKIISSMQTAKLSTLNISLNYNLKSFKMDLKGAIQTAGVEGNSVYLLIEDHQITDDAFLDMLYKLLSSGEVPELYNADEFQSVISSLKDISAAEGYSGSTASFFASRVIKNLHVVLVSDFENVKFKSICENYPRLFTNCEVIWLAEWSENTMKIIPQMFFSRINNNLESHQNDRFEKITNYFYEIHRDIKNQFSTTRRFLVFVNTFMKFYLNKKKIINDRAEGLKAGVKKLNRTKVIVDNLKKEAAEQEEKLAEKQLKASSALNLIGETMRNANTHREKMEKLREQTMQESKQLAERKKAIDQELSEVGPLIEEARQAVGNIKNESLSEIRSLRAPPEAIRDILEGVLRLMGIQDTSWNNMKTFLAKRGVKEEIRTFDAHYISAESKEAVSVLLSERRDSFDPKFAKRVSVAAAPLAAWVKANLKYAMVLEKIRPLEKEQRALQQNLSSKENEVGSISTDLSEVDEKVNELKNQLNTYTREAAVIEINLAKAKDTVNSAEELLSKLEDEYSRWTTQLNELNENLRLLSTNSILAAAHVSYLSALPENVRREKLEIWQRKLGTNKFSLTEFLASEQNKLKWVSEGLSSDELSFENAVIMLESVLPPLLIDPDGMASTWLKNHFADKNLEVISQHSPKLQTIVEFAVRFGKTLVVENVDHLHAILIPILRKDVIFQGPRQIIYIGEKAVDYHADFKMFLVSRNTNIQLHPDATSISFAVTQLGLSGQLLSLVVEQELPELGKRKKELLKSEETMKLNLYNLQEKLLQQLASAQGDILENKDLVQSLNETKISSEEISKALEESKKIELQLDAEYESYKAVADFGSCLFFILQSLSEIRTIYQFSVDFFKRLFQKSLKTVGVGSDNYIEKQKTNLIRIVYQFVSRSLFNSDRISFGLNLYSKAYPEKIKIEEWKIFKGEAIMEAQTDSVFRESLPSWIDEERHADICTLQNFCPTLVSSFTMPEMNEWLQFSKNQECEKKIPQNIKVKLSSFQILLLIQAFRPDRLHSAMTLFVLKALDIKTLSPSFVRLSDVFAESLNIEPILLIVSPGVDPSEELRSLAKTLPSIHLYEIAIGESQKAATLEILKSCSETGQWLCIKNLHLFTSWLGELEKEFKCLKPHSNFRLWMITELHDDFSSVLANSCLKVTYEAPSGIKKNLQRTFGTWTSEMFRKKGALFGRTMFAVAWFHAVVQERRIYIPQGWSTFYEFYDSDLRATVNLITRMFAEAPSSIDWATIRGLLLNSIYGGRMDNRFDIEVLGAYLREFFDGNTLIRGNNFAQSLNLSSSETYSDYMQLIHQLSDFDNSTLFGLPDNIERSWQKIKSSQVINQLKAMEQSTKNLSNDSWQQTLSPLLGLWKKLNQNVGLIEIKLSDKKFENVSNDSVMEFISKDFQFGVRVVHLIHQTLAGINKVIRNLSLANAEIIVTVKSLTNHQTPTKWLNAWEGSENPVKYLTAVVKKAIALQHLTEKLSSSEILEDGLDLSGFFQPERFLKAFKQLSARKLKIPVDRLELYCNWTKARENSEIFVRLKNLQLEGANFDGRNFVRATMESPTFTAAPLPAISYVQTDDMKLQQNKGKVIFPLYRTSKRETLLMALPVPCEGNQDEWHKMGAAFFLKE